MSNYAQFKHAMSLADTSQSIVRQEIAKLETGYRIGRILVIREVLKQAPAGFSVCAVTADTPIAAFEDTSGKIAGVQFHPESVLTQGGYQMLGNWLESIGLKGAAERAKSLSPLVKL